MTLAGQAHPERSHRAPLQRSMPASPLILHQAPMRASRFVPPDPLAVLIRVEHVSWCAKNNTSNQGGLTKD